MPYPRIVAIVGPTAIGKSAVALELARELNAAIVSADSRQVYRFMDVGTAKPTVEERTAVRHYMLDLATPNETYSAQRFQAEGRAVLRRLAAQGRIALVVGGTGFYVRALLDGMVLPRVAPDSALRTRLRLEAERDGTLALHRRLAGIDPSSAERIHPNNLPRLIRALEINEVGGVPVPAAASRPIPALYVGLRMEREQLRRRAMARVRSQVAGGLVEETRLLLEMGYDPSGPALSGLGYRQMIDYLQGKCPLEDAIRDYVLATTRYIRRQMTWFNADDGVRWLDADDEPLNAIRQLIEQYLASAPQGA